MKLLTAMVEFEQGELIDINVKESSVLSSEMNIDVPSEPELFQTVSSTGLNLGEESIYAEAVMKMCGELEEWVTPEVLISKGTGYHIVGNKFKKLVEDESNHSRWEEFRKMARSEATNEECSQLLRRMELQDSDEVIEDDADMEFTQDVGEEEAFQFEIRHDKKKQKRQPQWGPVQRMTRPRRYPEDGKTILQRAQELKEYKNLEKGNKPSLSVALESNKIFIEKAACVNISLGVNDEMIANNTDFIRKKDLSNRM